MAGSGGFCTGTARVTGSWPKATGTNQIGPDPGASILFPKASRSRLDVHGGDLGPPLLFQRVREEGEIERGGERKVGREMERRRKGGSRGPAWSAYWWSSEEAGRQGEVGAPASTAGAATPSCCQATGTRTRPRGEEPRDGFGCSFAWRRKRGGRRRLRDKTPRS
ncbi:hypothetical protein ZWY2020_054657 [Hordeum vulgare]|nr:hypothetical protein ZWY2020_054657 [Hordeum vulgare]